VQVVRGSHAAGLLSARGHTLSPAHVASIVDAAPPGDVVTVELKAGQAFLCHNWTVHRSGINTTGAPRRGFSVNFVDGRTRVCDPRLPGAGSIGETGRTFPEVFPRAVE
jgi:ectoine hydroxylase-related dioxygenase (phytanoyl-CoA dioxygenase family)